MDTNLSPNPVKKKNTTLIIVGVIVGICLILVLSTVLLFGALGRMVTRSMDPAVAVETAHKIADYDLPPGYAEQMSMSLPTYAFVAIVSTSDPTSPMIMLAQFSQGANMTTEDMQRQLSQAYNNQPSGSPIGQMHVVETLTMTIRGSESDVVISEGSMEGGLVYRQLVALFPGKSGQAMLMIQGMTDSWDEQAIDDFIASIR
jgi:hypothetical protein